MQTTIRLRSFTHHHFGCFDNEPTTSDLFPDPHVSFFERTQERVPDKLQTLLQLFCAITIAAGPRLRLLASRQFLRACAPQCEGDQKTVPSKVVLPGAAWRKSKPPPTCRCHAPMRALAISSRYSSPAIEPRPNVPNSIASSRGFSWPGFTLAFTKYRRSDAQKPPASRIPGDFN